MSKSSNPTGAELFTQKAAAYERGRPLYCRQSIDFVCNKLGLTKDMVAADIGAGTGLLTHELVPRFKKVIAVEPSDDMRSKFEGSSIAGTAEKTNLPDSSIDVVFAAQAFHWFDRPLARLEFRRILRKPKPVVLLWNERQSPKGSGAEELDLLMRSLRTGSDQALEADNSAIADFFQQSQVEMADFENPMDLTKEGLISMVLSRSYAPREGEPKFEGLIKLLNDLFGRHSINGNFSLPYKTQIYWGLL